MAAPGDQHRSHYRGLRSPLQHPLVASGGGNDVIGKVHAPPATSHPAQRGGPLGASAAPSSRDVHDAPATSPPSSTQQQHHDRLDPPVTSPLTSPVVTMDSKKQQQQQHQSGGQQVPSRRKGGSGSQQQLRSPVVKRPAAAPVALQGWLHKQGSEGLMLWKKRWFVLSEYCLFYYKGPEEEKLLGSILLPSYKISPCSSDDRVYRKFAFKAEHTNMRTYYFAADTRELMVQWMNALSLASILQEGSSWDDRRSGRPSVSSISSLLNQSADDSDSGFHGYRPPRSGTTGTASSIPPSSSKLSNEDREETSHQLNTSHDSVVSNGWGSQKPMQQGPGHHQPLYANAPPKPRRLTEHEDYGASSPEPLGDRRPEDLSGKKTPQDIGDGHKVGGFVPRIAQPQQPVRNDRSGIDVRYHYHHAGGQTPVHLQQPPQQDMRQPQTPTQQGSGSHAQVATNMERRTPDTYGRSNSTTPGPAGLNKPVGTKGGDYEDVYNTSDTLKHSGSEGSYGEVYKRSSSQVAYIKGAGPVISIHRSEKQPYPERGHGDGHPVPQSAGHYAQAGQQHQQQNYAAFRYSPSMPPQPQLHQQQADLQTSAIHVPNVYPTAMQQQHPHHHHHHHHHQSVQQTRHREQRPNRYPPRPHSADFLDYDAKRYHQHQTYQAPYPVQAPTGSRDHIPRGSVGEDKIYQDQQAMRIGRLPRPKSSLDVMPPPDPSVSDNYYWSEERYAQKMRQSASYMHQIPMTHPRQSSSSRATTPSVRLSTPSGVSMMTADGGMIHQQSGAQLGGVSSGGSVNSESAGVVMRHPKRTDLMQSEVTNVRSPSRQQYQQHQQRRWSEYSDPRANGQFMRSASARLPRQRYQDDENDSQCEEQRQKSTSDIREGEKKIQQREESMKRLLEWKQRMLQSPLTRKPSGSSTRGTAQNELSKYYKQQVLRELANQEARTRDLTIGQEGKGSSRRRSQLDETGTVPGRSALRSRSQDGRRSSTSLTRYNSYSSDDEEPSDVRKARKRVRRPSQAGRSRHGSAEGKPSRRHHHASVPPQTCTDTYSPPNYENVTTPKTHHHHHHHHHYHHSGATKSDVPESKSHRNSPAAHDKQEEIPPDVAYGEDYRHGPTIPLRTKHHGKLSYPGEHLSPESRLAELTSVRPEDKITHDPRPIPNDAQFLPDRNPFPLPPKSIKYPDAYQRSSNSTLKSSGDSTSYPSLQDDRCSNGKHSDSGYDTLQAGRVLPGFSDLIKFQKSNIYPRRSSELVYPVHELHWDPSRTRDPAKDKEEWTLKLNESRLMKDLYQYPSSSKSKTGENKDALQPRDIVESPPKNIVQSRIKAFETGKEGDETLTGREHLQMQEPLKMSPPMYHPNEAHVSSLKNADLASMERVTTDDTPKSRRGQKSDLRNFVFGESGSGNKGNVSDSHTRSRKNTNESEKHAKSVRDLLADFERKSQLVKERQAAEEERSSESSPGKRCVFSDTETLLYDTSSDAEGQSEETKQTSEAHIERQRSESRIGNICSDEDEDKDEEVAAALGRREKFFSSCRDLGRNRDPDYYGDKRHRKRKSSKSSLTANDVVGSDDLEVIVTPGYLRLSMAESLVTHEDSDSVCSTPTNARPCKSPDTAAEINLEKKSVESSSSVINIEEHYMPMTPSRKAVLAPPEAFSNARSPSAAHSVIIENILGGASGGAECEESSYVEMTEDGLVRSLLAPEPNSSFLSKLDMKKINSDSAPTYATPESPRYCEIGASDKEGGGVTSHYEFLYKASTQYEPVYMEVSPLMEAMKANDKLDTSAAQGDGEKKENSESSTLQESSEKSKSGEEDGVDTLPPTPPRTSLPDILNSSSTSTQQQQKNLSKSDRDSSDADDEASKDLDSLDAPRHPRFSLSDTFRPASYYLGASSMSDRALMVLGGVPGTVEHHDSSDSDLVSPPPIPTSPPPLDDFDNSLELQDSSLEVKKQSPMPSKGGSESELNDKDDPRSLWNKTPGHNKDKTSDRNENRLMPPFIPLPSYGSGEINSSGSESVELRKNDEEAKTIDRLLKRRPVSDDIIGGLDMSEYLMPSPYLDRRSGGSDLESIGSRSGLAMDLEDGASIDLDQYLEDLQSRNAFNVDFYPGDSSYDYYRSYRHNLQGSSENFERVPSKMETPENISKSGLSESTITTNEVNYGYRDRTLPDSSRSSEPLNFTLNGEYSAILPYHQYDKSPKSEEVQYENLQMILPPPPEHANAPATEPSTRQVSDTMNPSDMPSRQEDLPQLEDAHLLDAQQAGAPYYYSDLLKGEDDGFASSTSERSTRGAMGYPCFIPPPVSIPTRGGNSTMSRVQPLNNQRGDINEAACFVKRNDIGRKVNAIHQSATFPSGYLPQQVTSSEDESRRLAEELRSTTVHFLGTANKRGQVDERNLYEADTIQRRKGATAMMVRDGEDPQNLRYRSQTPDFHRATNSVNLYPHGLRDKSSPLSGNEATGRCTGGTHPPQRRSRSLEGLLDDADFLQGYSETQTSPRSPGSNRSLQSSGITMSLTNVPHSVATDSSPNEQNRNNITGRNSAQNRQGAARQELHAGMRNRPPPPVPEEGGFGSCEGDDLWEEDALWRESLRRVSLRHTRSLDNLDSGRGGRSSSRLSNSSVTTTASTMEPSGASSSGRRSADLLSNAGCVRQKISREVTYVNESMMRNHRLDPAKQREYEEDYREGRRRQRRRPQQVQSRGPEDAASGVDRDDGVHYERLSRYSESLERTRRGQTYLEGYIWDEDQEIFRKHRQTESPSSRQQHQSQQQQQQQQQQQHFLEEGSLPPQPPPPQPPPSFEIDREKLRQWDLMSSAPLLQQQMLGAVPGTPAGPRQPTVVGGTDPGVVVGAEGEETLPDIGGRQPQQHQQQTWLEMDLTMPHADEMDRTTGAEGNQSPSSAASGSGSVIGRDPLPPRAVSAMSLKDTPPPPSITLTSEDKTPDHSTTNSLGRKPSPSSSGPGGGGGSGGGGGGGGGPHNTGSLDRADHSEGQGKRNRGGGGGSNSSSNGPWGISVSAGELLGRTHEELVLLLIQLRRQSAGVCKAMETCHVEIEAQARLAELETPKRLEHLQKLDELKRHLLDLEKQYEKGKPLVNLVDNMVKLGSLYRGTSMPLHPGTGGPGDIHSVRERLEFNQKVQEQRLLAEERRDWDRVSPDRGQLQAKVQELYRLDRLLQEESGTLQSLQQDKELLEKALGGLRHKLQGSRANPAEAERYRKQQRLLEKELSRIRLLLAHNSKKLEETVAENARLEQELVVLRQKLQASRRGSQQRSAVPLVPDSMATGTTAALEAELRRVQQLVGDLQRQRQELSIQVRHLTEKSHSLVQQIRPGPTGVAGAGPIPGRKRHHSTWLETDLDSLVTLDHGLDSPGSPQHQTSPPGSKIPPTAPSVDNQSRALYVNTETNSKRIADQNIYDGTLVDGEDVAPPPLPAPPELPPDYPPPPPPPPSEEAMMNGGIGVGQQYCTQMDISEADDRMKRFYGIIPREKQQEIKTVRIVKRESERRQRDRDRSGNIGIPITNGTAGGKRVTIVEDGETTQYPVEKQQLGPVEEEPQEKPFTGDTMAPEDDPVLIQFQRSMSLPRGFGKRERLGYQQQQVVPPLPPVRVPSPRSDSVTVLRNLMINRHRVRFESCSGGSTSSAESTGSQRAVSPNLNPNRPLTAHEQLFGVSHDESIAHHYSMTSPGSSDVSPQLSPVFKSEAARAIVMEMSSMRDGSGHVVEQQPRRRAVPKEKRRHHTVSSSRPLLDIETSASPIMVHYKGSARSRDDLDMERALRPRLNAPDVVRSTMSHKDFKYNENTIDSILGTPNKIVIPERYIPEQAPELSAEEQLHRLKKAEAIRKMLSETTSITTTDPKEKEEEEQSSTLKKKVAAEKKQREHLLQLNQILAKQVMEKSKMVAGSTSVSTQE